jgi:hypothetical protein
VAQYLLSVYQPEGTPPEPEVLNHIFSSLEKLNQEMKDAGAWVFSGGLEAPSTATVVQTSGDRLPNGLVQSDDVLLTDGPFIEAKEYLGGFTIIEAEDLDAALEWGRKLTLATTLPIEVRPFHRVDEP